MNIHMILNLILISIGNQCRSFRASDALSNFLRYLLWIAVLLCVHWPHCYFPQKDTLKRKLSARQSELLLVFLAFLMSNVRLLFTINCSRVSKIVRFLTQKGFDFGLKKHQCCPTPELRISSLRPVSYTHLTLPTTSRV